jgi:spermidine synthase
MSNAAVLSSSKALERPASTVAVPAAVFVMSLSSLLLELSLTRLFSVILFYHFAFLAISIALLGLGAGGVFAYLKKDWLARWSTREIGRTVGILNAAAILIALIVVLHMSVSLQLSIKNFLKLTEIYLLSAVPFFGTGLVFSVVFARETWRVGTLYGADLVGGSAACVTVVPVLDFIGGPNAVLTAALLMAVAAAIWADGRKLRRRAVFAAALVAVLIGANYSGKLIDVVYVKGVRQQKTEFMRWNAISRVEVDRYGTAKVITIDADANTFIMGLDPAQWNGSIYQKQMMASPPSVANVLRPHGDYAIIGPGGGVDVLRAVANGSPSVTGIEINPLIANTIMRGLYADYSHHLYELPQVHIHVSDGRSWVRGTQQKFDVVQMTLVDTWASTAAGAFALSENNLYTVNAFDEYFQHLKPDGLIAITRWEFARPREALRVVSVAMAALQRLGVKDTRGHFIVVSEGPLNVDGKPVAVLAKKSAFTAEEESLIRRHAAATGNLDVLYSPSAPGNNAFQQLIDSDDPYGFSRTYEFNVKPVTDNAPFFFFTIKLGDVLHRAVAKGIDFKVNAGVAVLMMVFIISILAVAAFLVLPLWRASVRRPNPWPLFFFVAIGLGYILVEIAFIQRFVLFLGHPTYALTVVVFLMLLSSGVGSLVSRKWLNDTQRIRMPLGVIFIALCIALFALPPVLASLVYLPFFVKLVLSGMMLMPLGFVMGMPFPTGLRALTGSGEDTVEWAWALNAGASVLGSVGAMVVAIEWGLNVTLGIGALSYLIALFLTAEFKATKRAGHRVITDAA